MTHLTDMEELLASVISIDVRDYMREAMNSYMSGAYRGCIVLQKRGRTSEMQLLSLSI